MRRAIRPAGFQSGSLFTQRGRMRRRGARGFGNGRDQILAAYAVRTEHEAIVGRLEGKSVAEGIASDDVDLNGWAQYGNGVYAAWIVEQVGSGGRRDA
jgi:hypothetical protein